MRLAVVVVAFSAALTMALIAKLAHRGNVPPFAPTVTIVDRSTWLDDPVRKLPILLPKVATVIPRGATVACFMPVNGKRNDDYCTLVATGYLLRQRVVLPHADAEWIVAVTNPLDEEKYELAAVYPEGSLYKRRP